MSRSAIPATPPGPSSTAPWHSAARTASCGPACPTGSRRCSSATWPVPGSGVYSAGQFPQANDAGYVARPIFLEGTAMNMKSAEGGSLKGAVPVVAIHGGCGTAALDQKSPRQWEEIRRALEQSLRAAWAILREGGAALDAVEASVVVMEDSPHFNAGRGAALTAASEHELDAAIMDGASLAAGAVCSVRHIRNPVRAARAVMEHSDCVLICGDAADRFAQSYGLDVVDNGYFTTPERIAALASLKARAASGTIGMATEAERHGTVGAVALDVHGHLAAATSTGGFNGK